MLCACRFFTFHIKWSTCFTFWNSGSWWWYCSRRLWAFACFSRGVVKREEISSAPGRMGAHKSLPDRHGRPANAKLVTGQVWMESRRWGHWIAFRRRLVTWFNHSVQLTLCGNILRSGWCHGNGWHRNRWAVDWCSWAGVWTQSTQPNSFLWSSARYLFWVQQDLETISEIAGIFVQLHFAVLKLHRVLLDDTIPEVQPQIFSHNIQSYLRNTLSELRLLSWHTTRIMGFCLGSLWTFFSIAEDVFISFCRGS